MHYYTHPSGHLVRLKLAGYHVNGESWVCVERHFGTAGRIYCRNARRTLHVTERTPDMADAFKAARTWLHTAGYKPTPRIDATA